MKREVPKSKKFGLIEKPDRWRIYAAKQNGEKEVRKGVSELAKKERQKNMNKVGGRELTNAKK